MEDENKIETTGGQEGAESLEDSFLGGWNEEDGETGSGEEVQEDQETSQDREKDQSSQEGQQDDQGTQDGQERQQGAQDGQGGQEPGQAQPVSRDIVLDRDGAPLTIPAAEVPGLLRRGLDYELLKSEYDAVRPALDLMRTFAQQADMSLADYASHLRVQAKRAQGMEETEARQAVELEDREARIAAREAAERTRQEAVRRAQETAMQAQSRIRKDVEEFSSAFPEAARDYQSIPQEVWDAVNGGMSLVAAYARHASTQAAKQARAEVEEAARQEAVRKQNAQNAAASTGSMRSAGSGHGPKDPFLEGWDED